MRITHVLPALTKGGGERVAMDLANHAAANGHEVTILTAFPEDEALAPTPRDPRVELRHVFSRRRSRIDRYLFLPGWVQRNWKWIASQDVLHCHMTFGAVMGSAVQLRRRLSRSRRPLVMETYHAVGSQIPALHQKIHAGLAAGRDGFVLMAEDPFWRSFLDRRKHLPSKVVPNGVWFQPAVGRDTPEAQAYRDLVGVPSSCEMVLGSVGRMARERRPDLYIPVFAEVAQRFGDRVHFVLGGTGPELPRIQALADEFGISELVHFPGLVLDPSVAFSIIDLYITANIGPVTGVAAIEAAAAGLPVIAIQMQEGRQPGERDWIWSSSDLNLVAERAIALLSDPASRAELSGRQKVHANTKHGVDAMAEAYYLLYRELL